MAGGSGKNGGSALTVLLGLGEFGAACAAKINRDPWGRPDNRIIAVLRAGVVPSGVSFLTAQSGLTEIIYGGDAGSRAAIYDTFLSDPEPFLAWLANGIERLGKKDNRSGIPGRIRVFILAKAEDIDASALASALPPVLKERFSGFIAKWPISVTGFFLLPKGRSRRGAQVYGLLREAGDSRISYNHVFLISEASMTGLIGEEGAEESLAGFADLMTEPHFDSAVNEVLDISGAGAAGFGLTSIIHPIDRLIGRESARFAGELIQKGLFSGAGDSFFMAADEYMKAQKLDIYKLRDRLIMDEEGDITDRLKIGTVELRGVPLWLWVDRIGSLKDYLGHEIFPRLVGRMEDNLKQLSQVSRNELRTAVDDLMTEAGGIDKASKFLGRLEEKIAVLKEAATARFRAGDAYVDGHEGKLNNLAEAIKNFPDIYAYLSRIILSAPIAFFFFRQFFLTLKALPDRYISPVYIPPAVPAALFSTALLVLFMYLGYRRAENGLSTARDEYIEAIEDDYRRALDRAGWALLDSWLTGMERASDLQGATSWPEMLRSEKKALTDLKKNYLKIVDGLEKESSETPPTGITRPLTEIFDRENKIEYKRGRYELADEADRFAGLAHRRWRELGQKELRRYLLEFCRSGLSFADQRSVDMVVMDQLAGKENASELLDDLRRRSRPLLLLADDQPQAVELAVLPKGRQSPLAERTALFKDAALTTASRPNRIVFAQLICPVDFEKLAAFKQWSEDYEGATDQAKYNCAFDLGREGWAA